MNAIWKNFAELVELKAKTASIFPFLLGASFSWYRYQKLNLENMIIFFIAMLLFNMAVDIIDNYMDYKNATDVHDYREKTNIIGRENLSIKEVRNLWISFVVISAILGIWLTIRTDWIVLVLGIISFSVGFFYSSGPRPISSTPFGELASGLTMGYIIPLICVYINAYPTMIFDWKTAGEIFLVAAPVAFAIANLMLANNTCDLEEDVLNQRFTLVAYIGQHRAVQLFRILALGSFLFVTISVLFQVIPPLTLLIWLVFPKIWNNVQQFTKQQVKAKTFVCAVKNLALISLVYFVLLFIGVIVS